VYDTVSYTSVQRRAADGGAGILPSRRCSPRRVRPGQWRMPRWRRRSSRWPRSAAPVRFATRARWHPAYPEHGWVGRAVAPGASPV